MSIAIRAAAASDAAAVARIFNEAARSHQLLTQRQRIHPLGYSLHRL